MKEELMNGTPPGSIPVCHPSGWIRSDIFSQWFLHFIKHTETTKEDPAILVLDGHYSCTRNLEVITVARKNRAFRAGYLLLLSGLAKFKVPGQIWWLSGKVKGWCLNITMCFDSVYLTPFT